jgi:hypothetical protein
MNISFSCLSLPDLYFLNTPHQCKHPDLAEGTVYSEFKNEAGKKLNLGEICSFGGGGGGGQHLCHIC